MINISGSRRKQDVSHFGLGNSEFIYKYTVLPSDIDFFRHMSYANYLKLMYTSADTLFVEALGLFLGQVYLKATNTKMKFKHQTKMGDKILIRINSKNISFESFDLCYVFLLENTNNVVAVAEQTYRVVNINNDVLIKKLSPMLSEIRIKTHAVAI